MTQITFTKTGKVSPHGFGVQYETTEGQSVDVPEGDAEALIGLGWAVTPTEKPEPKAKTKPEPKAKAQADIKENKAVTTTEKKAAK